MKKSNVIILASLAVTSVGLCIPALRQTRQAARRSQCTNNLKQIGLAIRSYHDSLRKLPTAIASVPTKDFPPEKQLSWCWLISPYIEARMDPKFKANIDKPWDDPENSYVATSAFAVYICPANPNPGEHFSFTHYVGIAGVGKDAAWLPLADPKAGVFGYERNLTMKHILDGDGSSTTMMVAETGKHNGPWAIGGYTTARGFDLEEQGYLGAEGQFLSFHRPDLYSFKSVTLVAMADATVRCLTNNVAGDVLEALATFGGGEIVNAEDLDR